MKKLNKITNTLVCMLPVIAMGAAIAVERNADDASVSPTRMIWSEAPPAPPAPPEPSKPMRMMWVDHINVEGDVDRAELRARAQEVRAEALREQFLQFDLDGNGFITQAEFTEVMVEHARKNAEQMFQRFGDDGTGVISEERFIENFQERRIHGNRGHGARDISPEDRERIRQARELAREAAAEGRHRVIELRANEMEMEFHDGERLRMRGGEVTRTVDEDGNQVIIIKRKQKKED
ncbi:hypothetical protein A28LD_2354 [Idiomarina sp. A28L]|uniref:hypothetical protein n=1 Tax=Idiomarina sp. A28L TaxID=1036674 RepID=UPI000213869F|nr:hypothetical protein [Idiomarina sp. A28L]EGN74213.1 hypothetical protein A28LD_2354 [Idiomarina sp. A28L]